ncbi:MAG: hypothetical protein ACUVQ1_07165 [Candidatus Kapaibacteriales bacterium]
MFNRFSLFLVLFSITLTLFLQSCSEDNSTNNNTTTKTYFPTTVGSWWIFKTFDLDSNGVMIPETERYDTSKIIGSFNISGKMATALEERSGESSIDTIYFSYENDKIYTLLSTFNNDMIPIQGNQWIVIADFKSSSWTILKDTTLDSFDVPGVGTITPTLGIKGRKGNSTNVVVKGKAIPSQEFIITMKFNLKISLPGVPLPVNASFDMVQHIYFGENVGNVLRQSDPSQINVLGFIENIEGSRSELIDYSIK